MPDFPLKGRLGRAIQLAKVGATTGSALLTSFGAERAAEQAAEVLGNLRGLAAKVGQTLSYVDGVIPEKHREKYESALKSLQKNTMTSPPEAIRALLESELGRPVSEAFLEWSDTPVASASIGQVHRARLHDGRDVAVKVQHPQIAAAVESDLKNVGMLVELVGLAMPKGVDVTPVLDEVVQRFRDELDYRKEARYQAAFSQLWKGQPGVAIPEVVASHSTGKVLTSTWAHGITLDEAALLPEEERRRYAERLWAFVFRGNLVGGAFNADPHPGNFLFGPDGLVTFLDFGCVQPLPEAARRAAIQAHRGAANRDRELFRSSIRALMQMPEGPFADAMTDYVELCFQPIFDAPFRISREFTRGLTEAGADSKKILFAKGGRPAAPPPYLAMMNRVQFGFYSVLARLNVEVDYRMVDNWVLDEAEALSSGLILDELKRA